MKNAGRSMHRGPLTTGWCEAPDCDQEPTHTILFRNEEVGEIELRLCSDCFLDELTAWMRRHGSGAVIEVT